MKDLDRDALRHAGEMIRVDLGSLSDLPYEWAKVGCDDLVALVARGLI